MDFKRKIALSVALILFLTVILSVTFRKEIKAGLFLIQIIPNNPIKPLNLITPRPVVSQVIYKSDEGEDIYADLWLPRKKGNFPGVVLHLGVDIDKDDTRSQQLASAMARSGFAVLVPNINSLHKRRLLESSKNELISSLQFLIAEKNVNPEKTGFVAFCASGGLAAVAAADSAIREKTSFLVLINPYYDLSNIYSAISTHKILDGEKEVDWEPHFKTVEIYNREAINLLSSESERELLLKKLVPADPEKLAKRNFDKLTSEEFETLSTQAQNTYLALTARNKSEVVRYYDQRSMEQENFRKSLSPGTHITDVKAKTFLISDKNNVYIPFTEAKLLNESLKESTFLETRLIPSGEFNQDLDWIDYPKELLKIVQFIAKFFGSTN